MYQVYSRVKRPARLTWSGVGLLFSSFFAALQDQPARFCSVVYSFGLYHAPEGFRGRGSAFVSVAGVDVF
jgi:hypothetical protein